VTKSSVLSGHWTSVVQSVASHFTEWAILVLHIFKECSIETRPRTIIARASSFSINALSIVMAISIAIGCVGTSCIQSESLPLLFHTVGFLKKVFRIHRFQSDENCIRLCSIGFNNRLRNWTGRYSALGDWLGCLHAYGNWTIYISGNHPRTDFYWTSLVLGSLRMSFIYEDCKVNVNTSRACSDKMLASEVTVHVMFLFFCSRTTGSQEISKVIQCSYSDTV